jgi:hypothetical protein
LNSGQIQSLVRDFMVFFVESRDVSAGLARKVPIGLLCATSVFSVSLWLSGDEIQQPQRHREHRGCTEKSQNQDV